MEVFVRLILTLNVLALMSLQLTKAALYTDPSLIPQTQYDFIIIGAGTAGNVLANLNRLTEDASSSVLVVEAGISDEEVYTTQVPFLGLSLSPNTALKWNYTTTPQPGFFNRTINYPRGRVLGGCSTVTIDYLAWTRGSVDDWNRYAAVTGDDGWSWHAMLPYMLKTESLVPPSSGLDTAGEVNPAVHGYNGPVDISLASAPTPVDSRVMQTTYDLPHLYPYNIDMNSGYPLGLGYKQNSITSTGRRASSATAYLRPALTRSNLDVLILTQATKLMASDADTDEPSFTSVQVAQNAFSDHFVFQANKEVILSAGAIGTPQILQLSGIGDADTLRSVGITPIVNLSDVGENLIDHPILGNHWYVNSTATDEAIARNATYAAELYAQCNANGTVRPYACLNWRPALPGGG